MGGRDTGRKLTTKRKNISDKEKHIVFMKSGGCCAFRDCRKKLVEEAPTEDDAAVIGEIAHIVADSRQGPRGGEKLNKTDRATHLNLILLCRDHHKIIDSQVRTYSVAVLRQMKEDHESWVEESLSKKSQEAQPALISERIQSTVLPVLALPQAVFSAPCSFGESEYYEVKSRVHVPAREKETDPYILAPFALRDGRLYAFQTLSQTNPFSDVIDSTKVTQHKSLEMWDDPDWKRLYVNLLNRSLYKYAGSLQIRYDPEHKRFYFPVLEEGQERSVTYRPLNKKEQPRKVAWEPKFRHDGTGKGFWYHLAAGLRFHHTDDRQWCLSIRPERHLTKDGSLLLAPDKIGRKVTKLKAKMYNDKYMGEIVFWRDFLSQGEPRFVLNFGSQQAVIGVELIPFDVEWIGIAGDDKPFKNELYEEDLFTLGEWNDSISGEELEWEEWEDEALQDS